MTPEFWSGKRVLVTGHTGFKGSWMSLWLQSAGAEVIGCSLAPPSNPNLFEVGRVAEGMTSIMGDIRDFAQLSQVLREHHPDIVIHMAAQALVKYSYDNPVETFDTNIMGTVNLLEAIRQSPSVRAVVIVTSDKCYENREWVWSYRENEAMGGYDPYSSSKGCAELVTSAYRQSFFSAKEKVVGIASARAGNVIGGGDWAENRLVPDMVRAFVNREPVLIRNPSAIRPWQHVLEPVSGYLRLAEQLFLEDSDVAEAWNFGPSEEDAKPVKWIVEELVSLWGEGASWIQDGKAHPHEANYLKLDCSKAKVRLGWRAKWSLQQTLENIVSWHKAYLRNENMRAFTLSQISAYQDIQ